MLHHLVGRLLQCSPVLTDANFPELSGIKLVIDKLKMEKRIFFSSVDSEHMECVVTEMWRKYM